MSEQINNNTEEPVAIFKSISQRDVLKIHNEETNQVYAEISGYDLKFSFNLALLKSMEEIEATLDGIRELFREAIMKQILENKESE